MALSPPAHTEDEPQRRVYACDTDGFQCYQKVAQFHRRHEEQRFLLRGSFIFSASAMKLLLLRINQY